MKLGRIGLRAKARGRAEEALKVLQLALAQGPLTAYAVAKHALDMPLALGYSCAGEVIGVGSDVDHVRVGDLVPAHVLASLVREAEAVPGGDEVSRA